MDFFHPIHLFERFCFLIISFVKKYCTFMVLYAVSILITMELYLISFEKINF